MQRFVEVIRRLGFKDAGRRPIKRVPGVFHSYALDEPSGRLLHIHVHEQLVLGDDTTKNYRLPIEDAYLRSVDPDDAHPLPIPAPEFELVVFVVRMMLKHSTWDAIASRQGTAGGQRDARARGPAAAGRPRRRSAAVREHLPFVGVRCGSDADGASKAEVPAGSGCAPPIAWNGPSRRTRRRRPGADAVLRLLRRARVIVRRHVLHRPPPRARLRVAGALIAVVGGDGAGKSTVVAALRDWLSKDLATTTVHLGKPTSSLTSTVVRRVWKRGVRGLMRERGYRAPLAASDGTRDEPPSVGAADPAGHGRPRSVSRRTGGHAGSASAGGIVVSDRFPLPRDRAHGRAAGGQDARHARRQRDREVPGTSSSSTTTSASSIPISWSCCPSIPTSPSSAGGGSTTRTSSAAGARRSASGWARLVAIVVDAGRSKDEVLAEIKSAIWSRI